jgi:hypothetical protein
MIISSQLPRIAKRSSSLGELARGGPGRPIAGRPILGYSRLFSDIIAHSAEKMEGGGMAGPGGPSRQIAPPRIAKRSSFVEPLTSGGLGFAYRVSDRPLSGNLLASVGNTTPIQPLELIPLPFIPLPVSGFRPVSTRCRADRKSQVAGFQPLTKPFPIISTRFR